MCFVCLFFIIKNVKKILRNAITVFVTSILASFGVALTKENKHEEVKADSINLVNTTAFTYIAGTSGSTDAHLVVHLTDNDFGTSNQVSFDTFRSKISTLNFADNIFINGKSVNFDTYNADGFKLGSEVHLNTFAPTTGTFSIRINFNGVTTSDIQSVKLTKNFQIPSQGYFNNTSSTVYNLPSELNSYPAGCNWDWVTYMDTEVYGISTVGNTYLGLQLSVNDYPAPNGVVDGTIGNTFTNYATNVVCDNGATTVYNGYGLLSYNDAYNAIWIRTSVNSNTINTIDVGAGTILPSYNSVKADPKWPLYFKTTTAHTFIKNSQGAFAPVFEEVNTEVERVDFTSINDSWLSFALSNNDYTTSKQATFAFSAQYNFWSRIIVVDSSDNEVSLTSICAANAHIFNFSNSNVGEFSVNVNAPYSTQGQIKKIIIPSGTEFPDFSYINNQCTGRPKAFVTTSQQEFIYGSNRKFAKALDTTITGMGFNVNGYLGFVLSNNDYPALGNTDGGRETIYANFTSMIDISDIGLSFEGTYSLWSYTPLDDSIAPHVLGTIKNGVVNIPSGVLFPSRAFTLDQSIDPIVYKTSGSVRFLYNGTEFINTSQPWSISNSIVGLETHGNPSSNDFAIDIMLDKFDWPNNITNLDLKNNPTYGDQSYTSRFNTFNKIKAYDSNDNILYFTTEIFVNVWGKTGCLSIRLNNALTNMPNLSYVRIESGLELPTYNGFYEDASINKFADNSYYLISEEHLFLYSQDSYTFIESEYLEKETAITAVAEVEPYAQNSIISFTLSVNDYSGNLSIINTYRTDFDKLNIASYITINGVKLSDLSGFSSTDISISNTGKVSIRTPGNNTGYYYLDNGNRVYTNNLTKYEVRIAKGCQFPSYVSLTTRPSISTCYTVTRDYNFAWFNNTYVLEDNSFSNIEVEDLNITTLGYKNVGGSDRCIYIPLTGTDWPTASTVSADIKNTVSCPEFLNHIEVYDSDGDLHLPLTDEVFINVWGTGSTTPSIGFRTDIESTSDIKSVIIHEDCLIPSYQKYLGNKDSWYLLSERISFYSSLDGSFYKGSNLSAVEYATSFNEAFSEVCSGYDGVSSNLTRLSNKFFAFENIYDEELTSAVKNELRTSDDAAIIQMYSTYDYVVQKYGLTNFLGSDFTKGNNSGSPFALFNNISENASTYLVISLVCFTTSLCAIYFFKRKKAV